ncbi:ABC-2 type transport system permease protein [Haloplanus vescus]|uniref:ABC-2 type transport system permease protein n=1 Tax=Haloplanus vescus TaxID=555874 RepID=A0A1H3Z590_9EURY|nr:ABC transporter permease subunit [Haloplanus vescus]SEA18820.1 ABC-2 type transport system permease protein [Haloplanus vescus]
MTWQAVARKDFEDAVRSRWVLGLSVLFVLLVSLAAYLARPAPGQTISSNQILNSRLIRDALVTTLIPLIALVVAYNAVIGERESGSLKLLLSLPHSRADVVFGKVIGRSGAIAAPVCAGFLLPALIFVIVPAVNFDVASYLGYTALTAILGVAFVAIAVGFSTAASSSRRAVGGAIGTYFLFVPLWGAVQLPLQLYLGMSGSPSWLPLTGQQVLRMLRLLNPTGSFKIVSNAFLQGALYTQGNVSMQVSATLMLLVWILVPPLLGLLWFQEADL